MKFSHVSLLAVLGATAVEGFSPAPTAAFLNARATTSTVVQSTASFVDLGVRSSTKQTKNNSEDEGYIDDYVPAKINTKLELPSVIPSNKPMTRFERLNQRYKGYRLEKPEEMEDLDFGYAEFAAAVADTEYNFGRNEVVSGTCVEYTRGGALVDIGAKSSAFLPEAEAALVMDTKHIEDYVELDQEMEFQIISDEDENGQLKVSVKRIEYRRAWDKIVEMDEADDIFEAKVVGVNRGGAICLVHGLRAFLPGSHMSGMMATEDLIGTTLNLKFLQVDPEESKLVVSHRKALVEKNMEEISRGDIIAGVVTALKPYGAFVEVGGMSGLLHISQISYDRVNDLEQVLQPGMQVKCMIIDHDKVNGRIALSTKTLEPEPGDMLKDAAMVFDMAEDTAKKYHERMESERQAREEAARNMVLGLGDSLEELAGLASGSSSDGGEVNGDAAPAEADPLADVSDSLDSLLS